MEKVDRHQQEILSNRVKWDQKPLLRKIYGEFHSRIADHLPKGIEGLVVELGSGVADISLAIPDCMRTDLFPNPWIDQVENAYRLSFADQSGAAIILFDVFHHLRYPGRALEEFQRFLKPGGRVIIFDPGLSVLGWLVYGLFHPEPLGLKEPITWQPPMDWTSEKIDYYAAQANAHRIFLRGEVNIKPLGWNVESITRYADITYVLSGGYSKPQLYPDSLYWLLKRFDQIGNLIPALLSTRMLVVLQKQ